MGWPGGQPPRKRRGLTERQKLFVSHFVRTLNISEACRQAKVSPIIGWRYVNSPKYPHVQAEIQKRQEKLAQKLELDAEWVLKELYDAVQVAKASVRPKLNSKTGKPILDEDGSPVFTRNVAALLKALELIGKHLGMFKERVVVDAEDDLIERLREGRRRVNSSDPGSRDSVEDGGAGSTEEED
jgi:phage terminase small subunit